MTTAAIKQVVTDFLEFTHSWHKVRQFASFEELIALEQLSVSVVPDGEDIFILKKRLIVLARDQGVRRQRHTKMHELAHYLFKTAEEGRFISALRALSIGNLDAQRQYEEMIVKQAGLQLFIPRPLLMEAFEKYEEDARRAQWIAIKTGGSFAVAGQRIAWAVDRPVAGMIMDIHGNVTDFFGNDVKKLSCGRGFVVPPEHKLRGKAFEPGKIESFEAYVPFRHSPKKVPRYMHLLYDDVRGQVVVFFNAAYGGHGRQPRLILS